MRSLLLLALGICFSSVALAQYNELTFLTKRTSSLGNNTASSVTVSSDGRYTAFASLASNLVDNDTNTASDVFLYDKQSATLILISHNLSGLISNGGSYNPSISADGRYIAFSSDASDLVYSDTNAARDIFVYDRVGETTTRVSVRAGSQEINDDSDNPQISSAGTHVAYESLASNLVEKDNNQVGDVFLVTLSDLSVVRVSVSTSAGDPNAASNNPSLSSDGQFVAFTSAASNLVNNDSNGETDVFVRDTDGLTTEIASLKSNGLVSSESAYEPKITPNGRYVVFSSTASDLTLDDTNGVSDIFLRDLDSNTTEIISKANSGLGTNGDSRSPSLSSNGRYVAFVSDATNVIGNDQNDVPDVFIYDRTEAASGRVSVGSYGEEANASSSAPALSADGAFVGFVSQASNLVQSDTNLVSDAFLLSTECIIDLGATVLDTDGDSTLNCAEVCGNDATKTTAGQCGCNIADTDTDSDSTLDCNEDCDSDATKTSPGVCGCGSSESDLNGNGVADCLDPDNSTTPRKAILVKHKRRVVLLFPGDFTGVIYRVTLRGPGGTKTKNTRTGRVVFPNLSPGTYRFFYTVSLGAVNTKQSPVLRFRVK